MLSKVLSYVCYLSYMLMNFNLDLCLLRIVKTALFTLEFVVNYFVNRVSPVFMAAIDASKAFDKVNHYALFTKLIAISFLVYL